MSNNETQWEGLLDFHTSFQNYQKDLTTKKTYKSRKHLIKFVNDNTDDLTTVLASDNVELRNTCSSHDLSKIAECTICKTGITRAGNTMVAAIRCHIEGHSGPASSGRVSPCSVCFNFFRPKRMKDHMLAEHGVAECDDNLYEVMDFTNKALEMQNVFNQALSALPSTTPRIVPSRYISPESMFAGYDCLLSAESFRGLMAKTMKEAAASTDLSPVFRYLVKLKRKFNVYKWSCCLCDTTEPSVYEFTNDISLRLFVIYHLDEQHSDDASVVSAIKEESEILQQEVGDDVTLFFKQERKRLSCRMRSCFFFAQKTNEDNYELLRMMMERSDKEMDRTVGVYLCLFCFEPVMHANVIKHMVNNRCHKFLQAHSNMSEFHPVEEIAVCSAVTADNFPSVLLRYSTMYRIKDLDDTETVLMHKWRCLLPCCQPGHTDDVVEFSSLVLLRIYAMRHFETYHKGVFADRFIDLEWSLIRDDCKMNFDFRTYDPFLDGYGAEKYIDSDPTDYVFPLQRQLLADVAWRQGFKVCGFCFWSGSEFQFMDHIVTHGYVSSWQTMANNQGIHDIMLHCGAKGNKATYVPTNVEVSTAPRRLLGSEGKRMLKLLRDGMPLRELTACSTSASLAASASSSILAIGTLLSAQSGESATPAEDTQESAAMNPVSSEELASTAANDTSAVPKTLVEALRDDVSQDLGAAAKDEDGVIEDSTIVRSAEQLAPSPFIEEVNVDLESDREHNEQAVDRHNEMDTGDVDDNQLPVAEAESTGAHVNVGECIPTMMTATVIVNNDTVEKNDSEPVDAMNTSGPIDFCLLASTMSRTMCVSRDANVTQRRLHGKLIAERTTNNDTMPPRQQVYLDIPVHDIPAAATSSTISPVFSMHVPNPYEELTPQGESCASPSPAIGRSPRKSAELAKRKISIATALRNAIRGVDSDPDGTASSSSADESSTDDAEKDLIGASTEGDSSELDRNAESDLDLDYSNRKPARSVELLSASEFAAMSNDRMLSADGVFSTAPSTAHSGDIDLAPTQTESIGYADDDGFLTGQQMFSADTVSTAATPIRSAKHHDVIGKGTEAAHGERFRLERRIQLAFADDIRTWKTPPELTSAQLDIIEHMEKNKCKFCKNVSRVSGSVEEGLLAHFVLKHSDDKDCRAIVNLKKWKVGSDSAATPTPFLLELKEGKLCCASCRIFTALRYRALVPHYERCLLMGGRLEAISNRGIPRLGTGKPQKDPNSERSKRRGDVNDRVTCPVSCGTVWKGSARYPAALGQLVHLLGYHLHDKLAYEKAVEMSNAALKLDVVPYVDVLASFQLTVGNRASAPPASRHLLLKCSQCPHTFGMPHELVTHCYRQHVDFKERWRVDVKKCPFGCRKIHTRSLTDDAIARLMHVLAQHVHAPGAIDWLREEERHRTALMSKQALYKFSVSQSIDKSLECGQPRFVCLTCKEGFTNDAFIRHRKSGTCDETIISASVIAMLSKQKMLQQALKAVKTEATEQDEASSVGSGSQQAVILPHDECDVCHRNVPRQSEFTKSVSMLMHMLRKHHGNPQVMDDLRRELSEAEFANTYPHIDLVPSIEATVAQAGLNELRLVCALCGWNSYCLRRLCNHLKTHTRLFEDCGFLDDECHICQRPVRRNLSASDNYQHFVHVLEFHADLPEKIEEAAEKYAGSLRSDAPPFLSAAESSKRTAEAGVAELCCSQCPTITRNGLAFLHHSKQHIPQNAFVQPLPVRSKTVRASALPGPAPPPSPSSLVTSESVYCKLCKKNHTISKKYSQRVSQAAHYVRMHHAEKDVKEKLTAILGDLSAISADYPFCDFACSLESGQTCCALCPATRSGIHDLAKHARTAHPDLCMKAVTVRPSMKQSTGEKPGSSEAPEKATEANSTMVSKRNQEKLANSTALASSLSEVDEDETGAVLNATSITVPSEDDCLGVRDVTMSAGPKDCSLETPPARRLFTVKRKETEPMASVATETDAPKRRSPRLKGPDNFAIFKSGPEKRDDGEDAQALFLPVKKEVHLPHAVFSGRARRSLTATPSSSTSSRRSSGRAAATAMKKAPAVLEAPDLSPDENPPVAGPPAPDTRKHLPNRTSPLYRSGTASAAPRSLPTTPRKSPRLPAQLTVAQQMTAEWCDTFNRFGTVERQMRTQREVSEELERTSRGKGKQSLLTTYLKTPSREREIPSTTVTATTTAALTTTVETRNVTTRTKSKRKLAAIAEVDHEKPMDKGGEEVRLAEPAAKKQRAADDVFTFIGSEDDSDSIPAGMPRLGRPRDSSTPIPSTATTSARRAPSSTPARISSWLRSSSSAVGGSSSQDSQFTSPVVRPSRPSDLLVMQDNLPKRNVSGLSLKSALDDLQSESPTPSSFPIVTRPRDSALGSSLLSELPRYKVQAVLPGSGIESEPPDVSHIEGVGGFKCVHCHFVGLSANATKIHIRLRHQKEAVKKEIIPRNVISPCVICSSVFESRPKLILHIASEHKKEPSPYPCSYCDKRFANTGSMREHERRQHERDFGKEAASLDCRLCGQRFMNSRSLQHHMQRHADPNSTVGTTI